MADPDWPPARDLALVQGIVARSATAGAEAAGCDPDMARTRFARLTAPIREAATMRGRTVMACNTDGQTMLAALLRERAEG